jgi:hypothetical protein
MGPRRVLDTKTYWLTDRQSQCDLDLDLELVSCFTEPALTESLYIYVYIHVITVKCPLVREGVPHQQNRKC